MNDEDLCGQLVFLTVHVDRWLREVNSGFNVPMANRIAKVVKIFDWDTAEGKLLLKAREETGKWSSLNPRDFKFVLKIYYPELIKGSRKGIVIEELFPRYYPGSELLLFDVLPDWMRAGLRRVEKNTLRVEKKIGVVFSKETSKKKKKKKKVKRPPSRSTKVRTRVSR